MRIRLLGYIIAILFTIAIGGCGGGGKSTPELVTPETGNPAYDIPAGTQVAADGGFSLHALPLGDGFKGAAEYKLEITETGDGASISVSATAEEMHAALLVLAYDGNALNPRALDASSWPGFGPSELVELSVLDIPGQVHYGAAITGAPQRTGVSGSFELFRVEFADGPAPALRDVQAAPDTAGSVIPDLTVDPATGAVSFSYYQSGDYNQDMGVRLSDITPIAQYFNQQVPEVGGEPDTTSVQDVVDGSGDGIVSLPDLTPIAQNFMNQVGEWRIYGGSADDYPDGPADDNGGATLLYTINLTEFIAGQQTSLPSRFHFSAEIDELVDYDGELVWLRPSDSINEGIASTAFNLNPADTTPPVWDDTAGVTNTIPGDGQMRVEWGSATDEQTPPVHYELFYAEESANIDYLTPYDTYTEQTTAVVSGLTNGTTYKFDVRAIDSVTPPNRTDANTPMLGTPSGTTADITPPVWDDQPGIATAVAGNGSVQLSWHTATDAETPPVMYTLYVAEGTDPFDWGTPDNIYPAATTSTTVGGLTNGTTYRFAIRAQDSVVPANETGNTNYLEATPTDMDDTPPTWDNDPNGIGVVNVIPLDGGARVYWGAASDPTLPVTYTVYYSEGTSVDFGTAGTATVTKHDPPDPDDPSDQRIEISGLTNGTQYAFAVRAKDGDDNEDTNTETLFATPLAAIELPTPILADMEFDNPVFTVAGSDYLIDNNARVQFNSDLTNDGNITNATGGATLVIEGDWNHNGSLVCSFDNTTPLDPGMDTPGSLAVVVYGDVYMDETTSEVRANGNFYLVDDEAELLDPSDVVDEVDNGDPEEFPYNWDPDPDGSGSAKGASGYFDADAVKTTSRRVWWGPRQIWIITGDWGRPPNPPPGTTVIAMRAFSRRGNIEFRDFSMEAPLGIPGADAIGGCNPVGGDGKDNPWRLRMHCANTMTFNNATIKLGDGGDGGDAITDLDCCPGVATGGNGGKPLNKFRISAGSNLNVVGNFNFEPGNGGRGGDATAFGDNGTDGCLATDGCDATATGGDGGEVPRWGVRAYGNVFGMANVNLGVAEGGRGGDATATAGGGGADTCCPGAVGGDGGVANATAGDGGNSIWQSAPASMGGGGAVGGDGGDAEAFGGSGGGGSDCFKVPGGDGGAGGNATAEAGEKGTAENGTDGNDGSANAVAGNGGQGGDGCAPGTGGGGGTASATIGDPASTTDGVAGADGVENPPGCIIIWHIPVLEFVPGIPAGDAIPNGLSGTATLYDDLPPAGVPVGTVPFQWNIGGGVFASWDTDPVTMENYLLMGNESVDSFANLTLDLGGINLTEGEVQGIIGGQANALEAVLVGGSDNIGQLVLAETEGGAVVGSTVIDPLDALEGPRVDEINTAPDSFFDVEYRIEVNPGGYYRWTWITIIDPPLD